MRTLATASGQRGQPGWRAPTRRRPRWQALPTQCAASGRSGQGEVRAGGELHLWGSGPWQRCEGHCWDSLAALPCLAVSKERGGIWSNLEVQTLLPPGGSSRQGSASWPPGAWGWMATSRRVSAISHQARRRPWWTSSSNALLIGGIRLISLGLFLLQLLCHTDTGRYPLVDATSHYHLRCQHRHQILSGYQSFLILSLFLTTKSLKSVLMK